MKSPSLCAVATLLVACNGAPAETTATTAVPTTTTVATATTIEPLVDCPPVPYRVPFLPGRVAGEAAELGAIELDEFTAIGGTTSLFWVDGAGALTVALIRGALPPREWPGERGEVTVAGTRAIVGPFDGDRWVAAWFEREGERCDLYTMVFYPPVDPSDVEATLASITKGG